MSLEEEKTKTLIRVDIQDVITGQLLIPFHNGYGPASPGEKVFGQVRLIDRTLEVQVRPDFSVKFEPGDERSSIECIVGMCILINDMMPDDTSTRIPDEPSTVRVDIDSWKSMLVQDSLPRAWFVTHRGINMTKVIIQIMWPGNTEARLTLDAGMLWEDAVTKVQNVLMADEVANAAKKPEIDRTQYASVVSPPNASKTNMADGVEVIPSRADDFMVLATSILND